MEVSVVHSMFQHIIFAQTSSGRLISNCKKVVQILLDSDVEANTELREFGSSIHLAAFIGDLPLLQLLLQRGGDVYVQGGYFGTPLLAATAGTNLDMVTLALDYGVDVGYLSSQGRSALQYAFMTSNLEAAQLLLDRGADINGHDGEQAVEAVEKLITMLLRYKTMLNIKESDLITLMRAGHENDEAIDYRRMQYTHQVWTMKDYAFIFDGLSQALRADEKLHITEPILEAVVLPEIMKFLLEQENVCMITSPIMEKAVSRPEYRLDLVEMLMSRQNNFPVTKPLILGVLRAVDDCQAEPEQQRLENILQDLISHDMTLWSIDELLREVQTSSEMRMLLKLIPHHPASEELREAVASRQEHPSKISSDRSLTTGSEIDLVPPHSLVKVLLEYDRLVNITPKLVREACDSPDAAEFLAVLLDHNPELTISEDDFIALIESQEHIHGFDSIQSMKRRRGVKALDDVVSVLLKYDRKVQFTDKVRQFIDITSGWDRDE
ncbi:MAG: hypothetical protein Q9157_003710 [Trypethelium eluteriae]